MTTDETRDDDTATPPIREQGLTDADQEQIREYLERPPHRRSFHDLVPDSDTAAD